MNKTIKSTEEIFDKFVALGKIAVDTGLDKDYRLENTREVSGKDKWVRLNKDVKEALAFFEHLENHPEVINAPINPGKPMCKICNKGSMQILRGK